MFFSWAVEPSGEPKKLKFSVVTVMATYKGKVVGKVVVLEEGVELPEGAIVEVRLLSEQLTPSITERRQALQRILAMNLPVSDWEQMEDEIIKGAIERW